MTIQEIINQLMQVENKNIEAKVWNDEYGEALPIDRIEIEDYQVVII